MWKTREYPSATFRFCEQMSQVTSTGGRGTDPSPKQWIGRGKSEQAQTHQTHDVWPGKISLVASTVEPHEPVNFSHGLLRQFGQCQWRRRKLAGSPPAALELAFRNELFAFHEGKLWFAPGPRRDLVQQEFAKTPEMIGQPCGLGWGGRTPKMRCFTQFMVGKAKVVRRATQIHAFL